MYGKHDSFLRSVAQYVENHPEIAAQVTQFATYGLEQALRQSMERAADMEVALVAATQPHFKNRKALIHSKLMKWKGRTSMNWENLVNLDEPVKVVAEEVKSENT